ncbi:LuxR C-terminal-related transcriptional regulator [Sphingosinicella rhizophila]|uniref:LuxR C-terminal-related transcriptional regulator n=1 Tax=Sphingosinicella rhizophila TaxID=3050082 RepID=A0ABU3Q6E5_9SPHN|nr:LuxR C-terminal-related transcriptional regulator [Sphingosinicella sp. GR2756]MDT9598979.1 LuxR C-terminal-related transcriptional regulator [Sphingosinicella sp. GR2756]
MTDSDEPERLIASIEETPIATVITNPRLADNPIIAVNAAFERLTGYGRGDAIGRNCRFLAGRETETSGSQMLRDAIEGARPGFAELVNYRRDGSAFRNAVMIAPIFSEDGGLVYFIGSQMDVSHGSGTPAITRRHQAGVHVAQLTQRQRQVLQEMMNGYRNKQIAARLGISEKTVKMHRAALLTRLGVATSADAVRIAVEAGL